MTGVHNNFTSLQRIQHHCMKPVITSSGVSDINTFSVRQLLCYSVYLWLWLQREIQSGTKYLSSSEPQCHTKL